MRKSVVIIGALLTIAHTALAQPARPAAPTVPEKKAIEDNSFLAEEAFNQEDRVVQHISQFVRDRVSKSWLYAFTQEWPVLGQLNQFSYTITVGDAPGVGRGLGDAMLNWRYQAVFNEEAGVFSSPRLSLVLPTGKRGLGSEALGIQAVVPISIRLGDQFVTHIDPGYTHFSSARIATGERGSLGSLSLAHSIIWLATERFNVMLETTWSGNAYRVNGRDIWDASLLLNPGVRWAYNLASGMQIVPGISFPIGVGPSKGDKSVLLYLSFEHPF